MSTWPPCAMLYDGSFAGFLTCVGESFRQKGYPFYSSRKLDRVPAEAVEELLGIALDGDAAGRAPEKGVKTNGKRPAWRKPSPPPSAG